MNSMQKIILVAILLCFIGVALSDPSADPPASTNDKVKKTLELLARGENETKLIDNAEDLVFVLGNTGIGKTPFTKWLAVDNSKLISEQLDEDGPFLMRDDDGKIGDSITKSATIFPDLYNYTGTALYDFPGFRDTRGLEHGIATTYFMKKVVDHGNRVKMLIIADYDSVKLGGRRNTFTALLKDVADFVKDIQKFTKSIAFVVTKVPKYMNDQKPTDTQIIDRIARFILKVKEELKKETKEISPEDKKALYYNEHALKTIDVIVGENGEDRSKIGIFRFPDQAGPFSDITILHEGKRRIENIITNLEFTAKTENDFGYTISEESMSEIVDLNEAINQNLKRNIESIIDIVKNRYNSLVIQAQDDMKSVVCKTKRIAIDATTSKESILDDLTDAANAMSQTPAQIMSLTDPKLLAETVKNTIDKLDINVPRDVYEDLINNGNYSSFFQIFHEKALPTQQWAAPFEAMDTFFTTAKTAIHNDAVAASQRVNSWIENEFADMEQKLQKSFAQKEAAVDDIQQLYDESKREHQALKEIRSSANDSIKSCIDNINKKICSFIAITGDDLLDAMRYADYLEYLQTFTEVRLLHSFQCSNAFGNAVKYFENAEKWYDFLRELHGKLFKNYKGQEDIKRFNMIDKLRQHKIERDESTNASTIANLEEFLNSVDRDIYPEVKALQIDVHKVNAFKVVLEHIMIETSSVCSPNNATLTITGYHIKISEVVNKTCWAQAENIEIYAWNWILVDADIDMSYRKGKLSIIAPTWEIVNHRQIVLNGKSGANHKPMDKTGKDTKRLNANGKHGAPGLPGESAGHFFGTGDIFTNAELLSIKANGGIGGAGQDGEEGRDGTNGADFSHRDFYEEFSCRFTGPYNNDYTVETETDNEARAKADTRAIDFHGTKLLVNQYGCWYKITAKQGAPPGNGGNGGLGGRGGLAGNVNVVGLSRAPSFKLSNQPGQNGTLGKGGTSGKSSKTGSIYEYVYTYFIGITGRVNRAKHEIQDVRPKSHPNGTNGTDGGNSEIGDEPDAVEPVDLPHEINNFKMLARKFVAKSNQPEVALMKFIKSIDENSEIQRHYNTLSYVNELETIENQYLELRSNVSFVPYLESLLDRAPLYAQTQKIPLENKKLLAIVYIAAYTKLCGIKNHANKNTIVDLPTFLDTSVKRINDLREIRNELALDKYQDDFKASFDKKIEAANSFIENEIGGEIDKIFTDTDDKIYQLIDEITTMENKTKDQIIKQGKIREQMEKNLLIKQILVPFKVIASSLSVFGPVAGIVGSVVEKGIKTGESLWLEDPEGAGKVNTLGGDFKETVKKLVDEMETEREEYRKKMADVDTKIAEFLKDNNDTDLIEIRNKMNEVKAIMGPEKVKRATPADENQDTVDESDPVEANKKVMEKRKELEGLVDRISHAYKKFKGKITKEMEKKKTLIKYSKAAFGAGEKTFELIQKLGKDKQKIDEVVDAIDKLENDLKVLGAYKESIYEIMGPTFNQLHRTANGLSRDLKGKSHVELDVKGWRVKGALKDAKLKIAQMTKEFPVISEDLGRSVEKIEEAMEIVINVYDRIDSYMDQVQLGRLISQNARSISTQSPEIENEQLRRSLTGLNYAIHTNMVLEHYERALHAFKVHTFPFAPMYLAKFDLPDSLRVNDVKGLVDSAAAKIVDMREQITTQRTVITEFDQYLQTDDSSSHSKYSSVFYVWKNHTIKNEMAKLLRGQNITLMADIDVTKQTKRTAVKFKEIGIRFKLANESAQRHFDTVLETSFELTMTMMGNDHYRCGEKSYIQPMDEEITISYTLIRNKNGIPVRANEIFNKIKKNNYFLSPYAMWNIQIRNWQSYGEFNTLTSYANEPIDLELVGYGQYLREGPYLSKLCNDQLDKLYFDSELEIN